MFGERVVGGQEPSEGPDADLGEGLRAWVARSRWAAGLEVSFLRGDELMDLARSAAAVVSLAEATLAHALVELDERGTTEAACGLKAVSWLSSRAGLARGRASKALSVGRKLRVFDRVDAAVVGGKASIDHAAVIAGCSNPRVEAGLAAEGVQEHLLEQIGQFTTFGRWKGYVEGFAAELDQDGPHDPNEARARNRLRIIADPEGIRLEGRLVDESASVVSLAITSRAEELFRRYARDHALEPSIAIPDQLALQALALDEICRQAHAAAIGSTQTATPDVTVVIRAEEPTVAHDATTGVRLQDGTTRALLCDPALTAVIVDGLGVPLDVGRSERLATAAQRRALRIRDGGCVFPGCDVPHGWTRAHHVEHYHPGGRTDMMNLASMCTLAHHGLIHSNGWQMHGTGDGWFYFVTPSGASFWSQRHGRQRAGPTPADDPDWATNVADPRPP